MMGLSSHSSPVAPILCVLSKGLQALRPLSPGWGQQKSLLCKVTGAQLSRRSVLYIVPFAVASGTLDSARRKPLRVAGF